MGDPNRETEGEMMEVLKIATHMMSAVLLFILGIGFSAGWITYSKCDGYQLLASVICIVGALIIANMMVATID